MKQQDYIRICQQSEHKDMPSRLRHLKSGEIGVVVQCTSLAPPEGFLVDLGDELTTWGPDEVEEIASTH